MRVLVATNELQGAAPGDYSWTVEGELVMVDVTECAQPDRCGCGRGFPGVASRRATTTAMVVDLPHLDRADLAEIIAEHVEAHWGDLLRSSDDDHHHDHDQVDVEEQLADIADEYLDHIEQICRAFPVGSIVERNGTEIRARIAPAAA